MNRYSIYSDEELIARMASEDARAFTAVYNKYWKFLYSIACRKLNNASEAEEIVQDIFQDLWQRRTSLEVQGSLSSYLSVATNYKVFRVLARRELHAKYQESASHTSPAYEEVPLLEFEELKERLLTLVAALPKKCRLVFHMSREQAMTGREIAEKLSISEKTVESHITKALKHLKTGFGLFCAILFFFYR